MEIIFLLSLSILINIILIFFIIKITNNSTAEIDFLTNDRIELREYILDLFKTCKVIEGSSIISEDELVKLLYRKVKLTLDFLEKKYLTEEENEPGQSGSKT